MCGDLKACKFQFFYYSMREKDFFITFKNFHLNKINSFKKYSYNFLNNARSIIVSNRHFAILIFSINELSANNHKRLNLSLVWENTSLKLSGMHIELIINFNWFLLQIVKKRMSAHYHANGRVI